MKIKYNGKKNGVVNYVVCGRLMPNDFMDINIVFPVDRLTDSILNVLRADENIEIIDDKKVACEPCKEELKPLKIEAIKTEEKKDIKIEPKENIKIEPVKKEIPIVKTGNRKK